MKTKLSYIDEGLEGIKEVLELVLEEIRGIDLKSMQRLSNAYEEKWEKIRVGVATILINGKELGDTQGVIGELKDELLRVTKPFGHIVVGISEENGEAEFMANMELLYQLIEKLETAIEILQKKFGLGDLIKAQEARMEELRSELLELIREMHWLKETRNEVEMKKIESALNEKRKIEIALNEKRRNERKSLAEILEVDLDESAMGEKCVEEIETAVREIFGYSLKDVKDIDDVNNQGEKRKLHIETVIPESVLKLVLRKLNVNSIDELLGMFNGSQFKTESIPPATEQNNDEEENKTRKIRIQADIPISDELAESLEKKYKQSLKVIAERFKYENIERIVREKQIIELLELMIKNIEEEGKETSESWRSRGKLGKTTGRNVVVIPAVQKKIMDTLIETNIRVDTGVPLEKSISEFFKAFNEAVKNGRIEEKEIEIENEVAGRISRDRGIPRESALEIAKKKGILREEAIRRIVDELKESLIVTGSTENTISEEDLPILVNTLAEYIVQYNEIYGGELEEGELAIYAGEVNADFGRDMQGKQKLIDILLGRFGYYTSEVEGFSTSDELIDLERMLSGLKEIRRRYLKANRNIEGAMGRIIQNAKERNVGKSTLETLQQRRMQGGEEFFREIKEREEYDIEGYIRNVGFVELGGIFWSYMHLRREMEPKVSVTDRNSEKHEETEEAQEDDVLVINPVEELKIMILSPEEQIAWLIKNGKSGVLSVLDRTTREKLIRESATVKLWSEQKGTRKIRRKKWGIQPEAFTRKKPEDMLKEAGAERKRKKDVYKNSVAQNATCLVGGKLMQNGLTKTLYTVSKPNGNFGEQVIKAAIKDTAAEVPEIEGEYSI